MGLNDFGFDNAHHQEHFGAHPGMVVLDRYELFEPCGFGGTASVWRAFVLGTNHEVAIKLQTHGPQTGAHRPERLEREFKILELMCSPYIVAVNDFGLLPDGRAALVFEYMNGQTLGELLDDHGMVGLRESLEITSQVLKALQEVHAMGVVHRDIKPENIMLLNNPVGPRRLKIFDFGIAKVLSRRSAIAKACRQDDIQGLFTSLTAAEMTVGTPEYMAPEQISATDLGCFTDVYAVGIVLYEMLFGEVPYSGDSFFEIAHRHLAGILPTLPADLPPIVQQLLWRSLDRHHENRYDNAEHMLQDIEAALATPEVILYERDSQVDYETSLDIVFAEIEETHDPISLTPEQIKKTGDHQTPWGTMLEAEALSPDDWLSAVDLSQQAIALPPLDAGHSLVPTNAPWRRSMSQEGPRHTRSEGKVPSQRGAPPPSYRSRAANPNTARGKDPRSFTARWSRTFLE